VNELSLRATTLEEAAAGFQHYQELFEHALEGYVVTDPRGYTWEVNHAAAELLQILPGAVIHKSLAVLVERDGQDVVRQSLSALRKHRTVEGLEVRMRPGRGEPFVVLLKASAIHNAAGRMIALSWLIRDISFHKRLEQALVRSSALLAALANVTRRIESAPDASKVMDTLGHELKRMDMNCFIALLEPDVQSLAVRYFSAESETLALVERLVGVSAVAALAAQDLFTPDGRPGDPLEQLTARERQALQLIAEGHTNNQIAELMGISSKTVEKHRASLMSKLDVHDTAGLVRAAIKYRLIFIDD
jgi:PAS domain S-box-containing protein